MRKFVFAILATSLAFGCKQTHTTTTKQTENLKYFVGTVLQIKPEPNGYTAKLKAPNDTEFYANISKVNLESNEKYKELNRNNQVTLWGNASTINDTAHLSVRKFICTDNTNYSLSGIVSNIEYGTDGYTAKVNTTCQLEIYLTLSIPNLGDKYRDYTIGDSISANGELWLMDNKLQLHVNTLK